MAFVNDEPALLAAALQANRQGEVADHGLAGTYGATYGPLPVWIYQAYLCISHDLVGLVQVRAFGTALLTALALWSLGRALRLWPWFVPVVLASPHLWFATRALWDNTFLVPLCAVALASYAHFLQTGRRGPLVLLLGSLVGMLLVHFMALAFVLPALVLLVAFRGRSLWHEHRAAVMGTAMSGLLVAAPYLRFACAEFASGSTSPGETAAAATFPLLGARLLTATGLGERVGAPWLAGAGGWSDATAWMQALSHTTFALAWIGMAAALVRVVHAWRTRTFDTRAHAALLCLAVLAAQTVLSLATGKAGPIHYHHGVWACSALFVWFAVDAVRRLRFAPAVLVTVTAVPLVWTTVFVAVRIHAAGPSRELGATLGNQLQIAEQLRHYPASSELQIDVANLRRFPHGLTTLVDLLGGIAPERPPTLLRIGYRTTDPLDGRAMLVPR